MEHGISPFLWILLRKTCEETNGGFGLLRGLWANLAAWHSIRVGVEATGAHIPLEIELSPISLPILRDIGHMTAQTL